MTNYYLSMGYGKTYSTGTLKSVPTLPLTDDDAISGIEFHMSDDTFDYDTVRDEALEKLQNADTLTINYPNKAAYYIYDEFSDHYDIPQNQRTELWNSEGIVETYIYFTNAEEEEWYRFVNAEVDYYDDNGRPVPLVEENE